MGPTSTPKLVLQSLCCKACAAQLVLPSECLDAVSLRTS